MFLALRLLWSLLSAFVMNFFPSKPKDISGKVVLITGAGGGIGQQLAYKFALCGVRLALVDINEERLLITKANLKSTTCRTYKCDVSKREGVAKLGVDVKKDFENVDILVNCAGVMHINRFLNLTDDEIRQTIETNLMGTIWIVREFLQEMLDNNDGHIVNISSIVGVFTIPYIVDYCTSKYGVNGFGEALACELDRMGKTGIHVTTVYPAGVDTPMLKNQSDNFFISRENNVLLKPEYVSAKVIEGILINKRHIFIPDSMRFIGSFASSLPVQTMKMYFDQKKFGYFEEKN